MKQLEQILDITPYSITVNDGEPAPVPVATNDDEDTDYNIVRANYYSILQKGTDALDGALRVAGESEHPRAFEVVGGLMKVLADVNRQLIQVGEDKQKVKIARKDSMTQKQSPSTNIKNAVFVGNSSDLAKMLDKDE